MERTMSVEEKIKRAEEIYARRNSKKPNSTTRVRVNDDNKKDIKVFKKLIIQIIICLFIYAVFYLVKNSNYIFSEDFINKAKDILSQDTNFGELYENSKNAIIGFFNKEVETENTDNNAKDEKVENNASTEQNSIDTEQNGIGGALETQETQETQEVQETSEKQEEQVPQLSEEEQRIQTIKNTTTFIKPVEGTISSKYGLRNPTTETVPKNHTGTDIAANTGTKIISSTNGEVVLSSSEGDYGNHIKIQIGEVSVIYAHCSKLYVKQGDKVTQGQEIAEVGSTGNSTGPHLHFEIRLNEVTVDPEKILTL